MLSLPVWSLLVIDVLFFVFHTGLILFNLAGFGLKLAGCIFFALPPHCFRGL